MPLVIVANLYTYLFGCCILNGCQILKVSLVLNTFYTCCVIQYDSAYYAPDNIEVMKAS